MTRERFAPSPTGLLHLGHAYSALLAFDAAVASGGAFLLRIEDIDGPRCDPKFEAQMLEDLRWLGLDWPEPVIRQSDRMASYQEALDRLAKRDLIYPCSCTRKDIQAALSAHQEGDQNFSVYPGTCRGKKMSEYQTGDAIRLNMARAVALTGTLLFTEIGTLEQQIKSTSPQAMVRLHGDIVLARKDIKTSYHLAVTVDDAKQGVTHVTRGEDMAELTAIHVVLQKLLGYPTPIYRHHRLIRDEKGKRLAKRHDAMAIKKYREDGFSPQDIRRLVGL